MSLKTKHYRWNSSGRAIAPSLGFLPRYIHHSRERMTSLGGFEPVVPANEQPKNHALDLILSSVD